MYLIVEKDHYADFKNVYGKITIEQYRPILMVAIENAERVLSIIFTNTKVHDIIQCFQCGKFRCLYSKKALTTTQKSLF